MKFFAIVSDRELKTTKVLADRCEKEGIEFIVVNTDKSVSHSDLDIQSQDFVYRISTKWPASQFEKSLLATYEFRSFHRDKGLGILLRDNTYDATLLHKLGGVPMPKTEFLFNTDRDSITDLVELVGGFPVVCKVEQGYNGTGVVKLHTVGDIISLIEDNRQQKIILRELIDVEKPYYSLRSAVVGDEVVFSYKNMSAVDDFRSNVTSVGRVRTKYDPSQEDKDEIVKAVKLMGIEFGAVDYLYDKDGVIKILEVNFPFNFLPITQDPNLNYPILDDMFAYIRSQE